MKKADVCVYGATPAGIAAAIAVAKSSKRVQLVEPTAQVEGLLTGGLSSSDYHSTKSLSGSFLGSGAVVGKPGAFDRGAIF